MIELDVTRPAADERARVEVFYATDAERAQIIRRLNRVSPHRLQAQASSVSAHASVDVDLLRGEQTWR